MKSKRILKKIIIIFLIVVISFCLYNIFTILKEYLKINKADKYLQTEFIVSENSDDNSRLKIDWKKLLKINPDVIAWIDIPDTNISYPILKGETNKEYLYLDINRNYIRSGSIFVDSSQKNPFVDFNTIIYGHNLQNGSMFSDLEKYCNNKFADSHSIVYIYTPDDKCLEYKVFSLHKANSMDTEIYNTDVENKAEYIKTARENNIIKTDIDESKISSLITLSTCTNVYHEERYILHAVMLVSE